MDAASSVEGQVELLENGVQSTRRFRLFWARLSMLQRVAVAAVAVLMVGAALATFGARQVRAWSAERNLNDEVAVQTTIEVSAVSTSLDGGRLDYFVVVRNVGLRVVRIGGLEFTSGRLIIRSRNFADMEVAPGQAIDVPVSARVSCSAGPSVGGSEPLLGTVFAVPGSGRPRRVPAAASQAKLITDVADTLCGIAPQAHDKELSGLVT